MKRRPISMVDQRTGGISWTDFTWNPITGCLNGCEYCYLKGFEVRFEKTHSMTPMFHRDRIFDPLRKRLRNLKVFTGSAADMWGDWVPPEQIDEVLATACARPDYTFQFLTKNPSRYELFPLIPNGWYGTSMDGSAKTAKNSYDLIEAIRLNDSQTIKHKVVKFISFEPLLQNPFSSIRYLPLVQNGIDWVIIGADSRRGAVKPPKEWADDIIRAARQAGAAVWIKSNYGYPYMIQEWPNYEGGTQFGKKEKN